MQTAYASPPLRADALGPGHLDGYAMSVTCGEAPAHDTTADDYCHAQLLSNARVARDCLAPLCDRFPGPVLDVGCGVGESVATLLAGGYDAYGVDLGNLARRWAALDRRADRFFVVDAERFSLPFEDGAFGFAYSLGVIEHVGTVDGHATRRRDYHEVRRAWMREVIRTVRPGGAVLVGCPNRNFPIDMSHALDADAGRAERWLSRAAGVTVHSPWGEYFLCGFGDLARYVEGLPVRVEPLSLRGLLQYGRVPRLARPLVRFYAERLPRALLGTGFNPWLIALVHRER